MTNPVKEHFEKLGIYRHLQKNIRMRLLGYKKTDQCPTGQYNLCSYHMYLKKKKKKKSSISASKRQSNGN